MANPGKYSDRLTWLVRSVTHDDNTGQRTETFEANGQLWCKLEEPRANERIYFGALSTAIDYRCRIRGYPAVRAVDRFRDAAGETYLIQGVYVGDNETIAQLTAMRDDGASS